ncbi:hypothetical protein MTO96_016353 [Rhipicephalus appendiculatus]
MGDTASELPGLVATCGGRTWNAVALPGLPQETAPFPWRQGNPRRLLRRLQRLARHGVKSSFGDNPQHAAKKTGSGYPITVPVHLRLDCQPGSLFLQLLRYIETIDISETFIPPTFMFERLWNYTT